MTQVRTVASIFSIVQLDADEKIAKELQFCKDCERENLDGGTFAIGPLIGQKGRSALPGRLDFIIEKGLKLRPERNERPNPGMNIVRR